MGSYNGTVVAVMLADHPIFTAALRAVGGRPMLPGGVGRSPGAWRAGLRLVQRGGHHGHHWSMSTEAHERASSLVQCRTGQGRAVQCSSVQRTRAVHSRRSETLKSSSSSRLVVLRLGGKAAGPREGRRRGSVVMASLVAVEGRADGVTSELWDSIADNLPGAKTKTYGSRLRGCPYEDSRIATVSLVTGNPRGRTVKGDGV